MPCFDCSDDDEGPAGRRQVADHILPDCLETLGRYVGKGGHANARAALGRGPTEFIDRVCKQATYRVAAIATASISPWVHDTTAGRRPNAPKNNNAKSIPQLYVFIHFYVPNS